MKGKHFLSAKISIFLMTALSLVLLLSASFAAEDTDSLYESTTSYTVNKSARTLTIKTGSGGDLSTAVNNCSSQIVSIHEQDAAEANQIWTIVIPAGSYTHTKVIRLYSNMTVNATGAVIKSTNAAGGDMIRLGTKEEVNSGYGGYKNITVIGGTWDGNGAQKSDKFVMFKFGHATNVTLKNVTLIHDKGEHFIEFGAVDGITLTNCVIRDFVRGTKDIGQEAVQFDIAIQSNFPNYPSYDMTHCRNISITGCTFDNLYRGCGSHTAGYGQYHENITIKNNTFKNISEYAILLVNAKNANISGNKISSCGSGIDFKYFHGSGIKSTSYNGTLNANAKSVISGNTISMPKKRKMGENSFAIRLYGEKLTSKKNGLPKGNYNITNVTVQNNKITGNTRGILLYNVQKCKILKNKVNLKDAKATKLKAEPILLQNGCSQNRIEGNKLSHSVQASGIGLLSSCKKNIIQGNTISGMAENGIHLYNGCTGNTVKSNTVKTVKGNGINVSTKSSATITGNKVSGYKKYGVNVYKASAKVKSNTVSGAEKQTVHFGDGSKKL